MATSEMVLPIIDLKKARDPAQRMAVAKQLLEALETVGFLFVDNAEGFDPEKLLKHSHWFFNLSQQEKLQVTRKLWNPDSKNHYRGFFPTQTGETSYKEGFEIGQGQPPKTKPENIHPFFTEDNLWPEGVDGAEQFRKDMVQYYWSMLNASLEILRLICLGCELEETWFESMFSPDSLSTLRLLRYPLRNGPVPEAAMDGGVAQCCADHADTGFVTLLATFNYAGLEINLDGQWMAVPCRPQSLVMNIGDLLSTMSEGRFRSTRHRVIDTNVDRFSVPFFLEPWYNADISRVIPNTTRVSEKDPKGTLKLVKPAVKGQPYGPWLIDRMRRFAEYREILGAFTPSGLEM